VILGYSTPESLSQVPPPSWLLKRPSSEVPTYRVSGSSRLTARHRLHSGPYGHEPALGGLLQPAAPFSHLPLPSPRRAARRHTEPPRDQVASGRKDVRQRPGFLEGSRRPGLRCGQQGAKSRRRRLSSVEVSRPRRAKVCGRSRPPMTSLRTTPTERWITPSCGSSWRWDI
jgi:hypothetical protein